MQTNKYVPSINIIRDSDRLVHYIPTPNGNRVTSQISNDYRKGIRAFNLIGSYGTGKSSFLLALEKSLNGTKPYFQSGFLGKKKFGTLKLIGEYRSIIGAFADLFNLRIDNDVVPKILQEIYNTYHDLNAQNSLLLIQIDEFGKFLEYAAQHEAQRELYFVQQLAEFVGNPDQDIFLITTVHQAFESYSYGLTVSERLEWTKVKGRFREIIFNEPVDQLLYLAAEHIRELQDSKLPKKAISESYNLFKLLNGFTFSENYAKLIYEKLFPLDITSATVLTLALQRYGQNERSLFSFLEATDHTGLTKFNRAENLFFNLSCVFDYLNFNFYSFLTSKYNPDFAAWASVRTALEASERAFDDHINDLHKIIKTIGLLNIFAANGAKIDHTFLVKYALTCLNITEGDRLVRKLEEKQIIRYRKHSSRFVLYEGTDLDIQTALIEAANKVSEITDIPTLLKKSFDFTPVLTKAYSFETGTPRHFKYLFSEMPLLPAFEQDIDGYINLIFSESLDFDQILAYSENVEDAVLYGYYNNSKEIKALLYEIEKTQRVIDENKDDRVAKKELENILTAQQRLLSHYILNELFTDEGSVRWAWRGRELAINSKRIFNRHLSQICTQTYEGAPIFKNELVNRGKLSGSVFAAKKNFFAALVNHWDKPDLGFEKDKFPPEKTIYLSLLRENGLVNTSGITENATIHADSTFRPLWDASIAFLEGCKERKTRLDEFAEILQKRPFKLKQGLIDFWIPTFLFLKRHDFALFSDEGFIPDVNSETLDLLSRAPKDYYIKAFDLEGIKLDIFNSYRIFLNQQIQTRLSTESFIESIKPFLVFYRSVPDYTKNTKRLSKEALAIRYAIANSKDPEKTFFEEFPTALGFSIKQLKDDKESLQAFTLGLQNAVREIRGCFDNLLVRIENFIQSDVVGKECEFEVYKNMLQDRLKPIKRHLLLPHQKSFVQRIDSGLEDKSAWLISVAHAITGRSPENFKDEDEVMFYDKLQKMIFELDSLSRLSAVKVDTDHEEVMGVRLDSFGEGVKENLIRVPKSKNVVINALKDDLKRQLSGDNIVNIAALANLLKEIMGK
jgi:hypothetical protein